MHATRKRDQKWGVFRYSGATFLKFPPLSGLFLITFVLILFVFGGSSRYDQIAQIPVRLAAIALIAFATWRSFLAPRSLRIPALLLGAIVALVCLQLIPLPPGLWTALPGRSLFAGAADAARFAQPWRSLAISPDLATNSLLALTVPVAAFVGLCALDCRYWKWILPSLLIVITCSLFVSVIQLTTGKDGFTSIYEIQWRETAPGIFANRNHQALLLAIGFPLLAGWGNLRRGDGIGTAARWAAATVAALLFITLLAMGSRAGVFLGALGLLGSIAVIWSWFGRGPEASRRRRWAIPLGAIAATFALFGMAIFFGRGQAIDRLFAADPLGDKRARALPTVIDVLTSYFPFGSGFGSFDVAFRRAEPFTLLETTYFNQAHNDVIQVVLEGGLPGLVLLIIAIGWLIFACFRLWHSSSSRGAIVRGRSASIGLLLMLAASTVDYPLRTPMMMAIATALAFLVAIALDETRTADAAGNPAD